MLRALASDERQRVARKVRELELDRHARRDADYPERNRPLPT